jgi:hypothetical protein
MDSFWPCYIWLIKIIFMSFALDILTNKPVICFDELLLAKYEIDNSVINSNEDTKESS